jgi:hypothetical protein
VVSRDDLDREQLLLIEDGHCLRSHALQACRIVDPVGNEVFQATSLRTLIQMVAAELGITLMPQIAVDSELASTRNVVVRPLSPDGPFRTLLMAWRPTSSRGAEFRMLGNLVRECLTGTKTAFAPDQHGEPLFARWAARHVGIHRRDACQESSVCIYRSCAADRHRPFLCWCATGFSRQSARRSSCAGAAFFGWTVLPTRKFTRWSEEDELRMLQLRDAGLT